MPASHCTQYAAGMSGAGPRSTRPLSFAAAANATGAPGGQCRRLLPVAAGVGQPDRDAHVRALVGRLPRVRRERLPRPQRTTHERDRHHATQIQRTVTPPTVGPHARPRTPHLGLARPTPTIEGVGPGVTPLSPSRGGSGRVCG